MRTTEYYVHFAMPGAFMPETVDRKIDPGEFDIPWDVYSWYTYAVEVKAGPPELRSQPLNKSHRYLIVEDGPYTSDQLSKVVDPIRDAALISNAGQYRRGVVKTPLGNWQPVQDDDVVIYPTDIAHRRSPAVIWKGANPK